MTLIALLVFSLVASPSRAGGYGVSYTGGSCTVTTSDGNTGVMPYAEHDGGYGQYGPASYGVNTLPDGSKVATSGSVSCGGAITATFTWSSSGPGDDPPDAVVIAETANAYWTGGSGYAPAPTGASDNGLGFPEVRNSTGYPGSPFSGGNGHSNGVRYRVKQNPPAVFSITCTPTASLSGTGVVGPPDGGGGGTAGVLYSASASPVEIGLGGGMSLPRSKLFLIGQKVVGTVSTGGLSASSYQWNVDGGDPFKNWIGRQNNTTFLPLGAETNSSFTFRFKVPAKVAIVTCAMHLEAPQGTLPAGGLDVTIMKLCRVLRPDVASFSAYTPQHPGSFGLSGYPLGSATFRL